MKLGNCDKYKNNFNIILNKILKNININKSFNHLI